MTSDTDPTQTIQYILSREGRKTAEKSQGVRT